MMKTYIAAEKAYNQGEYMEAVDLYSTISGFLDSDEKILKAYYAKGMELMPDTFEGEWAKQAFSAAKMLRNAKNYGDAKQQIFDCGMDFLRCGEYYYAGNTFDLVENNLSEAYHKYNFNYV